MPKRQPAGTILGIMVRFLAIFLALSMAYTAVSMLIQVNKERILREDIINNEMLLIGTERTSIVSKLSELISDLQFISDTILIESDGFNNNTDIQRLWLSFAGRKQIYDQIRFIDSDGDEQLRINYTPDGPYLVADDELQNKAGRYYFTKTFALEQHQIYFSKLDLNIEGGVIEQPIKPMLRIGTPFENTDGEREGIVIVNYAAADLLTLVRDISSTSDDNFYLLNSDGYWLYNAFDASKEWAFMYEGREDDSFAAAYPDEWLQMQQAPQDTIITDTGVFIYADLVGSNSLNLDQNLLSASHEDANWFIVSHIMPDSPNGSLFITNFWDKLVSVIKNDAVVYLIPFVLALLFTILITFNAAQKKRVLFFSECDTMTGIYNRRAGLNRLEHVYRKSKREQAPVSICFIDINGLKAVNDTLGHDSGDELIISIVDGMREVVRNTDVIARLGGDEFLIVFEGIGKDAAERIWRRICEVYTHINDTEDRPYLISASHGIEAFTYAPNETLDSIVALADEKIYDEKHEIKKDLDVIRNS